ncbi:MAG: OsmC family peroxiredoxin [Rhizobiales bacterium]|nr:OsmC family peroxiredoxin [Hyphomicrobiales bacterium]
MGIVSTAKAEWKGSLKEGSGEVDFSGFKGSYTFASRFETGKGTNPEELIAAAHAGCYSMQLSGLLTAAGTPPTDIKTTAKVEIVAGKGITSIALETVGRVPGIDEATFVAAAEKAKEICPVSQALKSVPSVTLKATFAK